MTEVRRFSAWCQLCLDGDPRPDAHELHVLHAQRVHRAQILERRSKLPWRWEVVDPAKPAPEDEKPLPRGSGQGPQSPALAASPQVSEGEPENR